MRVLVIPKDFPTPQNPQAGIFILRRLQAMQERGHEIFVLRIVPYSPPFGPERWRVYNALPRDAAVEGIPVRTIRAVIPPRMLGIEYLPLQVHRAVAAELRRVRADLVHASYILPCGQIAARQALPSIVTMHGIDAHTWPDRRPGIRRATREVLRRATQMTAVSGALAREIQRVEPCDVRVIWNGADERFFFPQDRAAARSALQLPADRFIVAYAGVMDREKGVYDLIDAVSRVRERRPLLVFAGTGIDAAGVDTEAHRRGVELRMLGRLPQERIAQVYAAADVVALASWLEGMPNVICEAMLSQRAVVSTMVGGVPEIVRDGEEGLLVPIGDTAAFARALERCAADEQLRDRLAENARAFAARHLTWRNSARSYDDLYHEVCERAVRKAPAAPALMEA
jgi:glycosyltransferase involved in cell wall biosynthesis